MNQALVYIRWKQLGRQMNNLGILYSTLLLGTVCFLLIGAYRKLQLWPDNVYISLCLILPVLLIQLYRKDKRFIASVQPAPWKLYALEYIILLSPFILLQIFSPYPFMAAGLAAVAILISHINLKRKNRTASKLFSRILPVNNYEWIAGCRSYKWLIVALYILAWALVAVPFASIFILWVLSGIFASFYIECEPRHILESDGLPAGAFLKKKLFSHLKLYLLIAGPVLLVYALFHTDLPWLPMLSLLFFCLLISLAIVAKYALYSPNAQLSSNNFLLSLAMFSVLIPFLLPLPIIKCIMDYPKALKNLNRYLDAYH